MRDSFFFRAHRAVLLHIALCFSHYVCIVPTPRAHELVIIANRWLHVLRQIIKCWGGEICVKKWYPMIAKWEQTIFMKHRRRKLMIIAETKNNNR